MKKVNVVDPPSGWMYGFPKIDDYDYTKESRVEWFLRNGYPQELIDKGMLQYCRHWQTEIEE